MSQNSSNNNSVHHLVHRSGALARPVKKPRKKSTKPGAKKRNWWMIAVLPAWVLVSFIGSQLLLVGLLFLLKAFGINLAAYVASPIFNTIFAALVYIVACVIAFGVPYLFKRGKVTLETLGLNRLMSWSDIGLAPIGFIAYMILAWLTVVVFIALFPGFSPDQVQDVGFSNLSDRTGYLLAFTTLVVIAPIAEELLFRGYLYGKLRAYVPIYAAIIVTSLLFAVVHLQWNVGVNVFALSIVLCGLREITGNIWAGILLHMIKNMIAFYILFISPLATPMIGG